MGIVSLTYLIFHELHHLILDRVAFCLLSRYLHVGTMLTKFLVLLLVGRTSAFLVFSQQAVNHRVRITADR